MVPPLLSLGVDELALFLADSFLALQFHPQPLPARVPLMVLAEALAVVLMASVPLHGSARA